MISTLFFLYGADPKILIIPKNFQTNPQPPRAAKTPAPRNKMSSGLQKIQFSEISQLFLSKPLSHAKKSCLRTNKCGGPPMRSSQATCVRTQLQSPPCNSQLPRMSCDSQLIGTLCQIVARFGVVREADVGCTCRRHMWRADVGSRYKIWDLDVSRLNPIKKRVGN